MYIIYIYIYIYIYIDTHIGGGVLTRSRSQSTAVIRPNVSVTGMFLESVASSLPAQEAGGRVRV